MPIPALLRLGFYSAGARHPSTRPNSAVMRLGDSIQPKRQPWSGLRLPLLAAVAPTPTSTTNVINSPPTMSGSPVHHVTTTCTPLNQSLGFSLYATRPLSYTPWTVCEEQPRARPRAARAPAMRAAAPRDPCRRTTPARNTAKEAARQKKWAVKVRTGCLTCRYDTLLFFLFFSASSSPEIVSGGQNSR